LLKGAIGIVSLLRRTGQIRFHKQTNYEWFLICSITLLQTRIINSQFVSHHISTPKLLIIFWWNML